MVGKLYRILDKIRSCAIITMLGGIVVLSLVQITLRYFTSASLRPFAWGDEVIRLTAIWVAFLAASVGVKNNSHLSVEFFLKKFLSEKQLVYAKKAATVIVIVALVAVTREGVIYTLNSKRTMLQNLPNMSIAWFYAAIPTGCAFLILEYAITLFQKPVKKEVE